MPQHGVGQTQVTFGIFKINGIDLVRHGARTHFTALQFLFEVAQRHITPDITGKVNQNGIGARNSVEKLGHVIVRFNLNAVGLKGQSQTQRLRRFNHFSAKSLPIKVRPGRQMCVVVAHCPVHFCLQCHVGHFVLCCQ